MDPLVSVIIPCYNAEDFLQEALESVFCQTYPNIEIIAIDDGSSDNTLSILEKYKNKITIIKQTNQGVSAARNNGINIAQGPWIAFLDADDIWLPKKLEIQMANIGNAVWSHSNSFYFGANQPGNVSRSDLTPQYSSMVFNQLIINNFITTSSILIQKDVLISAGGFDESLAALEDWKLWISISKKYSLAYQQEVLLKYRVHSNSTSRNARKVLNLHYQVIGHIFSSISTSDPLFKLKKLSLSESNYICSYIAEDSGDLSFAFLCSLKSFYLKPMMLTRIRRVLSSLVSLASSKIWPHLDK